MTKIILGADTSKHFKRSRRSDGENSAAKVLTSFWGERDGDGALGAKASLKLTLRRLKKRLYKSSRYDGGYYSGDIDLWSEPNRTCKAISGALAFIGAFGLCSNAATASLSGTEPFADELALLSPLSPLTPVFVIMFLASIALTIVYPWIDRHTYDKSDDFCIGGFESIYLEDLLSRMTREFSSILVTPRNRSALSFSSANSMMETMSFGKRSMNKEKASTDPEYREELMNDAAALASIWESGVGLAGSKLDHASFANGSAERIGKNLGLDYMVDNYFKGVPVRDILV